MFLEEVMSQLLDGDKEINVPVTKTMVEKYLEIIPNLARQTRRLALA